MVKRFFKDSVIYGLSNLLTRGLGFLLIPLYTRVFSPSDYGLVDILVVFASLANITVALEVSQAVARFFTDAETREQKTAYASTSWWFTLAAYTAFLIVAMAFAEPISLWLLESNEKQNIFRVALGSIWVNGLFYLVQSQLRWELKSMNFALMSLVFTFVSLGTTVFLVLVPRWGVASVFWGQFIGGIVGTILGFILVRQSYRLQFDWTKLRSMLKFSLPLVPSSLGIFVALYIDRIALKELMDLSDVGLFGVGYRVASITGLLMVAFQSSLMPIVYTHYRETNAPLELARIFRYFVAIALLICLVLGLFAPEIIHLITTPDYYAGALVVPLLAPAVLLYNMYIFAPGLAIAKQTGWMAVINIMCAIENTILNFGLIPYWGITGAALSTFISASSLFAAYMIASQRLYHVPHAWKPLGISALIVFGMLYWGVRLPDILWLSILLKGCLITVAGLTFIIVGLVDQNDIKKVLMQFQHLVFSRTIV